MSKKVFVRLGVSDIILTKEENENFNGYLNAIDEDGNEIAEVEVYLVGYELEDGTECDEDGNEL